MVVLLFGSLSLSYSQQLRIKVLRVFSNVNTNDGTIEHTWRFYLRDNQNPNYRIQSQRQNGETLVCFGIDTRDYNRWFDIQRELIPVNYSTPPDWIQIQLEGFEDQKGDRCGFSDSGFTPDRRREFSESSIIRLRDIPPGQFWPQLSTPIVIASGRYMAEIQIYYDFGVPNRPTVNPAGVRCFNDQMTLTTDIVSPNKSGVEYVWESLVQNDTRQQVIPNPAYCGPCGSGGGGGGIGFLSREETPLFPSIPITGGGGSDCDIAPCCCAPMYITQSVDNWRHLRTTSSNSLNITPSEIPNLSSFLGNSNRQVRFRVRARAGSFTSGFSTTGSTDIAPAPPTYNTNITESASCAGEANGSIQVRSISGNLNDYTYRIFEGHDYAGCSGTGGGCISIAHGPARNGTLDVSGLDDGDYTFVLFNDNSAACASEPTPFTIEMIALPTISTTINNGISCAGAEDARIDVSVSGGKEGFTFSISPNRGTFTSSNSTSGRFTNLPAGNYTVTVTDNCGETSSRTVNIENVTQVTGGITLQTSPDCVDPANGRMTVVVSEGSGTYNYRLYLDNTLVREEPNTTSTNWLVTGLSGGNYRVEILDQFRLSCAGYSEDFTLAAPEPLDIILSTSDDVVCFGEDNGSATLTGSGGTGSYTFTLHNNNTGEDFTRTDGVFTSLTPGTYDATIQNDNGCNDATTLSDFLSIAEPDPLAIDITQQNITCFADDNGSLSAIVSGGNGGFIYQWQFNDGSGWTDYTLPGGTTNSIENLFPSNYRLMVTDNRGCSLPSATFAMEEPDPLVIDAVDFTEVTCFGEDDATINVSVSGGWGGYTFFYSADNWATESILTTTTLLSANDYQVKVVDIEGCETVYDRDIVITAPDQPVSATYTLSNYQSFEVSCFDAADGQIVVNAIGGNAGSFAGAGYTYAIDGSAFGANNIFSSLLAGDHTVRIMDGRGCILEETVTLDAPDQLGYQLIEKNTIVCFSDASGIIEISANGGVAPYSYAINGGALGTNSRFENLVGGDHFITIEDSNGCTITITENIPQLNPPLVIDFQIDDVNCFDGNDGQVIANVSGGVAPYSYAWIGRTETINEISVLTAGTYTLLITDNVGCTLEQTAIVAQPDAPLSATGEPQHVLCFGESNGSISVDAIGGTPPYQYSNDNGQHFQNNNLFNNLIAGTYPLQVVDANGCSFDLSVEVLEPTPLTIDLGNKTDINCFGDDTGSISVMAAGGAAPYRFTLDNITFQDNSQFDGLTAGDYVVHVVDTNFCSVSIPVTLTQPDAPLAITYDVLPVQCKGDENGTISTFISGGTAPYTYQWVETGENTQDIANLAAGDYTLIVTDALGCELDTIINVPEPDEALSLIVTAIDHVSCFGLSDARFSVQAQGGYAPYLYSFEGGEFGAAQEFFGLGVGLYQVLAKDTMACITMLNVEVTQPFPLEATIINTADISCFGGSDGLIDIETGGGTAPYQYSLDGGITFQPEGLFENLTVGNYTITVQDANGCTVDLSTSLEQPAPLLANIVETTDASCGQANGSAIAEVNGGVPPYHFSWILANEVVSTEIAPENLFAGFYIFSVIDANGCETRISQAILDEDGPSATITSITDATCADALDGSATVAASGGAGNYSYLWSDPLGQVTPIASNLAKGDYYVTVTDERGCVSISTVTIGGPEAIEYTVVEEFEPLCHDSNEGILEIVATGGIGPYTYEWLDDVTFDQGRATNLTEGLYQVRITDAIGCEAVHAIALSAPAPLDIQVVENVSPTCFNGCDGLATVAVTGGTGPYAVVWNDPQVQQGNQATGLCAGAYNVTVTDAQGCVYTEIVNIAPAEPLALDLGGDITLCLDHTRILDAGIANATYTWERDGNVFGTDQVVTISQSGSYQLTVVNEMGCVAIDNFDVITTDQEFEANFLAATESVIGDTLLLTEFCIPKPDRVEWEFPEGIQVVNDDQFQPQILINQPGEYNIKLTGYLGDCIDEIEKTVSYFEPDKFPASGGRVQLGETGIKTITVYPNPTSGRFSVEVSMHQEAEVAVFLYDIFGTEIRRDKGTDLDFYTFDMDVTGNQPGIYLLKAVSGSDEENVRVVLR
ncbi:MAG: T9SS type A sorting domain-containing protein [Bacteroidota bacterium]